MGNLTSFTCPAPVVLRDQVLLGHGSGGKLSAELMRNIFLPFFRSPILGQLNDQAVVEINGARIAFTTDSFVVKPLFFPGGDIGSLAVHGTVNDLAMGGARPLFLSAAFILEEGLPMETLRRVAESMGRAAEAIGVEIVTGDTKVVEKGSGDGLFINTTGIGLVRPGIDLSPGNARPGDAVLLSGTLGDHGITILAEREGIRFESDLQSDSAPLDGLAFAMLDVAPSIRCFRDPTRGGLSSTCNEIAVRAGLGIELEESAIPIRDEVRGACEMLGLDPLYVANEGKLVAIVPHDVSDRVLHEMRRHPLGRYACRIGRVTESHPGVVTIRTAFGTSRIVDMLSGDQLPRIC